MPLFLWKKSYEIGIAEIDQQHRHLVCIINELSDAMMVQKGYLAVPHILEQLVDYIQLHFTTEEELMHSTNYPGLNEQSQAHLEMTGKILEFRKSTSRSHKIDPSEILAFLCDWLKNHIVLSDKKFGAYVQEVKKKSESHLKINEAGD